MLITDASHILVCLPQAQQLLQTNFRALTVKLVEMLSRIQNLIEVELEMGFYMPLLSDW